MKTRRVKKDFTTGGDGMRICLRKGARSSARIEIPGMGLYRIRRGSLYDVPSDTDTSRFGRLGIVILEQWGIECATEAEAEALKKAADAAPLPEDVDAAIAHNIPFVIDYTPKGRDTVAHWVAQLDKVNGKNKQHIEYWQREVMGMRMPECKALLDAEHVSGRKRKRIVEPLAARIVELEGK